MSYGSTTPPPDGAGAARVAGIAGLFAAAIGLSVLAGWQWNVTALTSLLPGLFVVKANAGLCLLLTGTALWCLAGAPVMTIPRPWLGRIAAGLAGALALATCSQHLFGWNLGIDQLLYAEPAGAVLTSAPGRMPPQVGLSFLVLNLALLLLESRRAAVAIQALALVVALFMVTVVTGYLFGASAFPQFGFLSPMGLLMAVGLGALAVGVLAATATRGFLGRIGRYLPVFGFGSAVALLVVAGVAVYVNARRLVAAGEAVARTYDVLHHIEAVEARLLADVAATRAFVATDRDAFLSQAGAARAQLREHLATVRQLTADNPGQQSRLDELVPVIERRLARGDEFVRLRAEHGVAAATELIATGGGERLVAEVHARLEEMTGVERQLLAQRQADTAQRNATTFLALGFAGSISLGLLVSLFASVQGMIRRLETRVRQRTAALRASEVRWQTLVDTVPVGIVIHDAEGRLVHSNVTAQELLGFTLPEALGRTLNDPAWRFLREEGSAMPPAEYPAAQVLERREPVINMIAGVHRTNGGEPVWVLVNAVPSLAADGTVREVVVAVMDVTDRERAEAEIRRLNADLDRRVTERTAELAAANRDLRAQIAARERLQSDLERHFHLAQDLVCVASFDGWFKELNPAWERAMGWTIAELTARPFVDFVHPDDRAATAREVALLRTGGVTVAFENRYLCRDGSYRWLLWNTTADTDRELLFASARDVTERKRMEEALRASEVRYREIFALTPVSIWEEEWAEVIAEVRALHNAGVTDFEGYCRDHPDFVQRMLQAVKVVDVNSATLDMFEAGGKEEMLRSLETVFATPDTLPGFVGELVALAEGKTSYSCEMALRTVRANLIHTLLTMTFPAHESSRTTVYVGVMDVSERKAAELRINELNESLRQQALRLGEVNKELEAFSYSVSHDLRAPLRSIEGFVRILLDDYAEHLPAEGREHLQRVVAASQRMSQLIEDMLHLSGVTRAEMRLKTVDLSRLAQEVMTELRDGAPDRTVEVVIPGGLTAEGDAKLLRVMLSNLLGNAWKFTSKTGAARIEIGRDCRDPARPFFVRDNGAGFDMAHAAKLFGVFQRLHTTAEFPGTGVGLATVQRIVQRHGGRVWAEAGPDRGATFYFTLGNSRKAEPLGSTPSD